MFFESTHVKILFIAPFYLTHILLPFLLVLEVNLYVLLQVGGGCKAFAAFLTDKRLFFLQFSLEMCY